MRLLALADGIGRIEADGTIAVLAVDEPDLARFVQAGKPVAGLARVPVRTRLDHADHSFGSIVAPNATIWGIGLNYRSKERVTGRTAPSFPTLFVKAASAVVPAGGPIVIPADSTAVDIEAELAIVVGSNLYRATPAVAEEAICGFVAANDVTARDVMERTGNATLAKSFPTFGQFGAVMADPEEIADLRSTTIRSTVDARVWQEDRCGDLVVGLGELLSIISQHAVLRPGDIVLTGTPSGSGVERGEYLREGSVVEVTVGDLPPLVASVEDAHVEAIA